MRTIRKLDVYSVAKTFGIIYTVLFAVIGLIRLFTFVFLDSLPTFPIYYSTGNPAEMSVAIALLNYGLGILLAFAGAAFTGGLLAWLYNVLEPYIGGMQVQLD